VKGVYTKGKEGWRAVASFFRQPAESEQAVKMKFIVKIDMIILL
jgi:hypothetical protein